MEQNETKIELNPKQELVLAKLMSGLSIARVSKQVKVSRATIYRWKNDDLNFIAALNRAKRDLREVAHARLSLLALDAIECLESCIASSPSTALAVLRGLGLLSGVANKIGSDDPQLLSAEKMQELLEKTSQNPFY